MTQAELVPNTIVSQIVAHRDAALGKVTRALALMAEGLREAEEAVEIEKTATGGASFYPNDRSKQAAYSRIFESLDVERSLKAYREHLDAKVWTNLIERTGMRTLMDRTALEAFKADLCGNVPEVTEGSVFATLEGLRDSSRMIFLRGLAAAFIKLDKRFKSHDAFRLGSRVILTRVFDEWGSWGHWSDMRATITDLERVFAVLDGRPEVIGSLVTEIDKSRGHRFGKRQSLTESEYFRVRAFQNGNAHLWFTRDDLVAYG